MNMSEYVHFASLSYESVFHNTLDVWFHLIKGLLKPNTINTFMARTRAQKSVRWKICYFYCTQFKYGTIKKTPWIKKNIYLNKFVVGRINIIVQRNTSIRKAYARMYNNIKEFNILFDFFSYSACFIFWFIGINYLLKIGFTFAIHLNVVTFFWREQSVVYFYHIFLKSLPFYLPEPESSKKETLNRKKYYQIILAYIFAARFNLNRLIEKKKKITDLNRYTKWYTRNLLKIWFFYVLCDSHVEMNYEKWKLSIFDLVIRTNSFF